MARFIETFCRLSKGEWAGQPLVLRPWQREILDGIFALRPDGRRSRRLAYIGLPRKNGKSGLVAALAVYGLIADGERGAEVYSCAGDKQQARIVFEEAKKMIEADPDLSMLCRIYRSVIEVPTTGSVYRVLSADAALQQGLNPSFVLFDEVHVQPDGELWTAMTLGSGTRRQPLVIGITTAGFDDESLAYRLYAYGKKIASGEVEDPTFYFRWWEPAGTAVDYRDPAIWAEANPAYGDFLRPEDFETTVRTTIESEFRRYRLNQWVKGATTWLPYGAWDGCQATEIGLDPALPLVIGVDVGLRHDSSAVSCAQKQADRTVVRCQIWENPYQENDARHQEWTLNIAEVEVALRQLRERFPVPAAAVDGEPMPGPAVYYDPTFFERSAQELERDGLNMIEMPQNNSRMVPVSQTFYDLIVTGQIAHDGDPALTRHVGNVVADETGRGWRMSKPKTGARKKIDGAIASAIAAWGAQQAPPADATSVYEERGLLVF